MTRNKELSDHGPWLDPVGCYCLLTNKILIFGFENYVAYLQGMAYLQNVASERVVLYWSIKVTWYPQK